MNKPTATEAETCLWEQDINLGFWATECGEAQQFELDGIKENNYKFCPFCGKKIREEKYSE